VQIRRVTPLLQLSNHFNNNSMNTPDVIRPVTENNGASIASSFPTSKKSKSYYIVVSIFSFIVIGFLLARVVEIIDSSFMNPFHFPMMIVSFLAVGSLFISPPRTMALTVRRVGLTLFVSSFLVCCFILF
jgi:hypothetical protein